MSLARQYRSISLGARLRTGIRIELRTGLGRDERGQALVELALVMLILLVLLFGIVEVGRVGHAYLVVVHASREGARLGALGKTDSEVFDAVRRAAVALDADKLQIEIDPPTSSRTRGAALTVQVEYEVELFAPIIAAMLTNPFPVAGQTVMRVE